MKKTISILLCIAGLLFSNLTFSQDIPPRPEPPRLVNDFAGFLKAEEASALEQKLVTFNDSTSTQIAVVIVKTLGGYDIASYAFALGEKWGVGQKGKNNGIVILIKPKTVEEKGEAFIATGYGLEAVVPDATAHRIVDYCIIPNFKEGKYYQGIDQAVSTLISLTKKEFTADQYMKKTQRGQQNKSVGVIPMLLIFCLIFFLAIAGRIKSARQYAIGNNLPFWTALALLAASHRHHHDDWNDFSSGGGIFGGGGFGDGGFGGGFGGGDFGGFGGGSFGGGGAGGSW